LGEKLVIYSQLRDSLYLAKNRKTLLAWHRVIGLYVFVLVTWALYRYLLRFPVWFEETWLKGLVFGAPVFWLALKKDRWRLADLGITSKNLFSSVYLGLGLGIMLGLFGQMGNLIRYGGLQFSNSNLTADAVGGFILLALITAFWEQLLFAGYMLPWLSRLLRDEVLTVWVLTVLFMIIHLPALVFAHELEPASIILSLGLLGLLGAGGFILALRQKNLMAPILAHALWGVTVFLFR
jgi:hypothetical protein